MTQLFTNSLKTADEISHFEKVSTIQQNGEVSERWVQHSKANSIFPNTEETHKGESTQRQRVHTRWKHIKVIGFTQGENRIGQ